MEFRWEKDIADIEVIIVNFEMHLPENWFDYPNRRLVRQKT
jgi:hypothetical protein